MSESQRRNLPNAHLSRNGVYLLAPDEEVHIPGHWVDADVAVTHLTGEDPHLELRIRVKDVTFSRDLAGVGKRTISFHD